MNLKKVVIVIFILITTVILSLTAFILWSYRPFIHEQRAFKITHNTGKTIITNSEFDVRFVISDVCELDAQVSNYIFAKWYWGGDLLCDGSLSVSISPYSEESWNNYSGNIILKKEDIYQVIVSSDDTISRLIIRDKVHSKVLVFTANNFAKDIFNELVNSLEFVE